MDDPGGAVRRGQRWASGGGAISVGSRHTPAPARRLSAAITTNFDAIKKLQRLSELATDLYLAEGKRRDLRSGARWRRCLRKLEVPAPRVAHLLEKRDPALLIDIVKELEKSAQAILTGVVRR